MSKRFPENFHIAISLILIIIILVLKSLWKVKKSYPSNSPVVVDTFFSDLEN